MITSPITVQQAMYRGITLIDRPSMAIMVGSTILFPIAIMQHFYWWQLFIIPVGILLSLLYSMWVTPRWRIWAYGAVNDIHQLQRSAELAAFLKPQSQLLPGGFM